MKTTILVQNLKCGGCANTILNRLEALENISEVQVETEDSKVSFTYGDEADLQTAQKTLLALGYPSVDDKNSIATKAKSYISCATGKMSK